MMMVSRKKAAAVEFLSICRFFVCFCLGSDKSMEKQWIAESTSTKLVQVSAKAFMPYGMKKKVIEKYNVFSLQYRLVLYFAVCISTLMWIKSI